ncbi:response regulator [Endothiovibrio diazotrophicus]
MFVDDNPHYLGNVSRGLSRRGAYRYFSSPHDGLDFLRGRDRNGVTSACVSVFADNPDPVADHVIRLDLRAISRTLFNPGRFDEVSVVVVNYDMPGINGIEFCRQLGGFPVKRLLFTGTADERVAVEAFNEGVIDGFLPKGEASIFQRLSGWIDELQRRYFADLSRFVGEALAYDSMGFIRDPAFVALFERLCAEREVAEYYVSNEPAGLVLVDGDGRIALLAVQSAAQMEETRALAVELGVAKPLVAQIAKCRSMPVFWWGADEHEGDVRAWAEHLYPAESLEGRYFYTLVEGVESRMGGGVPLSFSRFLERQRVDEWAVPAA